MGMSMIKAMPCICFSVAERQIINNHGFISYPEFLDNFWVKCKGRKFNQFQKALEKHKDNIRIGVLPDGDYPLMSRVMEKYQNIDWLFPLHRKEEIKVVRELKPKWVGFPHREQFRDYNLIWFLENVVGFQRWYLGFWAEDNPYVLGCFDGFDTTLPETYSGKYGKVWTNWGVSNKPKKKAKTIDMFETNIVNFKRRIQEIKNITRLDAYVC
jgi:hypothetical protein